MNFYLKKLGNKSSHLLIIGFFTLCTMFFLYFFHLLHKTNINKKEKELNTSGEMGMGSLLSKENDCRQRENGYMVWFLQEKQARDWEMTSGSPYYP